MQSQDSPSSHTQTYVMFPFFLAVAMAIPRRLLEARPSRARVSERPVSPTDVTRSRMWDIPELLLMIFELLSRRDLVSIGGVCRHFWAIATPFVWKSLTGTKHPTHLFSTFPRGLRETLIHGERHPTDQVSSGIRLAFTSTNSTLLVSS